MTSLARMIDGIASAFCDHEWSRRTEPDRLYLECVKCSKTTQGIPVGKRLRTATPAPRPVARASVLALLKTQRAA